MSFEANSIVKVAYIPKFAELYIEFQNNIQPSYDCACFVDVPAEVVRRMKDSTNRDEFFQQNIRKKFKYYLTIFELCEVFIKSNYDRKSASDIETPAEYEARLKAEMERLDKEAMKSF